MHVYKNFFLGRKAMTNLDSVSKTETTLWWQRSMQSKLWFFQQSCNDLRVEPWRSLSAEEIMVLEKTFASPLDSKEIQPVHPKRNKLWILFGRTDAEAEALVLWPPDAKNWLIGKDPDAGKDWGQEEKGTTEDEMVSITDSVDMNWNKLQKTAGQGSLACWNPWGLKASEKT